MEYTEWIEAVLKAIADQMPQERVVGAEGVVVGETLFPDLTHEPRLHGAVLDAYGDLRGMGLVDELYNENPPTAELTGRGAQAVRDGIRSACADDIRRACSQIDSIEQAFLRTLVEESLAEGQPNVLARRQASDASEVWAQLAGSWDPNRDFRDAQRVGARLAGLGLIGRIEALQSDVVWPLYMGFVCVEQERGR